MTEQEELDILMDQAYDLGIVYTGDDASELTAIIGMAEAEAGVNHQVPCFGQSYDPTYSSCRICQLQDQCAAVDDSPRVKVTQIDYVSPVTCGVCGEGTLTDPLEERGGGIINYLCTCKGCGNSLSVQCGWKERSETEVEFIEEPKPKAKAKDKADKKTTETPLKTPVVTIKSKPKAKLKSKLKSKKKVSKKTKPAQITQKAKPLKKLKPKGKSELISVKVTLPPKKKEKPAKGVLSYKYEGKTYADLSLVVAEITGSKAWSTVKFFGPDCATHKKGDVLKRTFKGYRYEIEVM